MPLDNRLRRIRYELPVNSKGAMAKVSITKRAFLCNLGFVAAAMWFGLVIAMPRNSVATSWTASTELRVPEPAEEFRGVWIATVYNIDWPSKSSLSPASQKAELIALLDLAESLNLNAVVLQVRSMADAIYDSPIEPWSSFLTGKSGRPPSPRWDPLAFAVNAAHSRGLELHAWFNPFRASVSSAGELAKIHITRTNPEVIRRAGSTKWLDPTSPLVRERALDVIVDVVNRYDVDGVHIDDYFYPYPGSGGGPHFDDNANWEAYVDGGGKLDRADWRRDRVNAFIREYYRRVKAAKFWVKVGVSPFGIWRPGIPEGTKAGLDAFEHIYADSKKWLNEGWIDYFSPQLYWKINGPQAFPALFDWWQQENTRRRHLWPGISTARIGRKGVGESDGRDANEIDRQIDITRGSPAKPATPAAGHLHWSISSLKKNAGGIADHLRDKSNQVKVLVPASPWLAQAGGTQLPRVEVAARIDETSLALSWHVTDGGNAAESQRWWCVQVRSGVKWRTARILPAGVRETSVPDSFDNTAIDAVAVRAIDRVGGFGPVSVITPFKSP